MPTPSVTARPDRSTTSSQARPLPGWMREPLLHFLFLGGVLFAVDHLLITRADDPHTIVLDADVDKNARDVFAAARGLPPSAAELVALRQVWLDNEVLYREGLAMQVDKGDTAIRERVIFKALSVVDASTRLPVADDKVLRAWFDANRARYDEPMRFDFQEAVLTGDNSEGAVRAFVMTLSNTSVGDAKADLRVFKGRPLPNLLQSYGAEFAKGLEAAPIGEWRAQPSRDGVRAIRLEAVTAPKPASFEVMRNVVHQDWADATLSEQRSAAVHALAKKYTVKTAGAAP